MSNKIANDLKKLGSGMLLSDAKKAGIHVPNLKSKGLVEIKKERLKRYLVPENAPRWAVKFKYSRKLHGIEEHVTEKSYVIPTRKGSNLLKHKGKKTEPDEEDDKSEPAPSPEPEDLD